MGLAHSRPINMTANTSETFFGEISTFLCRLQRQEGRANEHFTGYALERLEVIAVKIANVLSSAAERNLVRESRIYIILQGLHALLAWDGYCDVIMLIISLQLCQLEDEGDQDLIINHHFFFNVPPPRSEVKCPPPPPTSCYLT